MDYETKRVELVDKLGKTITELAAVRSQLAVVSGKSKALIKAVYDSQTNVKIATAEAFSMIEGEGKNAYAQLGDKIFSCSNEQLRSAFVTTYAEPHIKACAMAESNKAANDAEMFALKDELNALMTVIRANTAELESFGKNADLLAVNGNIELVNTKAERAKEAREHELLITKEIKELDSLERKEGLSDEMKLVKERTEQAQVIYKLSLEAIAKQAEANFADYTRRKELIELEKSKCQNVNN